MSQEETLIGIAFTIVSLRNHIRFEQIVPEVEEILNRPLVGILPVRIGGNLSQNKSVNLQLHNMTCNGLQLVVKNASCNECCIGYCKWRWDRNCNQDLAEYGPGS